MGEYNIFRKLTAEERIDMTPLGTSTLLGQFIKENTKKHTEYQKKLRPYDSYSARIDFENNMKTKMSEYANAVDKSVVSKFEFGDLDKYADTKNFEFIEATEQQQTRLVAGIKQEVVMGMRYRFKGKSKGNKLSIFVYSKQVEEFEKWLDETYRNKPKKEAKETVEVKQETIPKKIIKKK